MNFIISNAVFVLFHFLFFGISIEVSFSFFCLFYAFLFIGYVDGIHWHLNMSNQTMQRWLVCRSLWTCTNKSQNKKRTKKKPLKDIIHNRIEMCAQPLVFANMGGQLLYVECFVTGNLFEINF